MKKIIYSLWLALVFTTLILCSIQKVAYASQAQKTWTIQLGAFNTHNISLEVWRKLEQKHSKLFSNLYPAHSETERQGKTLHRLRVGHFNNKKIANDICAKLIKHGTDCYALLIPTSEENTKNPKERLSSKRNIKPYPTDRSQTKLSNTVPPETKHKIWAIQLGAYNSHQISKEVWKKLQEEHGQILFNLLPEYSETISGKRTLHRLRTGRFTNKKTANDICVKLTNKGTNCYSVLLQGSDNNHAPYPISKNKISEIKHTRSTPLISMSTDSVALIQDEEQNTTKKITENKNAIETPIRTTTPLNIENNRIIWAGADFTNNSYFTYAGTVSGLSGQNIHTQDGFLLRLSAGHGQYEFTATPPSIGKVKGRIHVADIMTGYKKTFPNGGVSFYLGGSVENHDRSANDAGSSVNGTNFGLASSVDAQAKLRDNISLMGMASYSTANDSYWSHFSAGYILDDTPLGTVTIGPTTGIAGGQDYQQRRIGGAISGIDIGLGNAYVYSGYEKHRDDSSNMYFGLGLDRSF